MNRTLTEGKKDDLSEGDSMTRAKTQENRKGCRWNDYLSGSRGRVIGGEGREVGTMLQGLARQFGESGMNYLCYGRH